MSGSFVDARGVVCRVSDWVSVVGGPRSGAVGRVIGHDAGHVVIRLDGGTVAFLRGSSVVFVGGVR